MSGTGLQFVQDIIIIHISNGKAIHLNSTNAQLYNNIGCLSSIRTFFNYINLKKRPGLDKVA
jgi:hypothetical protein